jgi:hypothetical protein
MPIRAPGATFTIPGLVLLVVLVAAPPAAGQTEPADQTAAPSALSNSRVVVRVYVEPSFNRMADWRGRVDGLKADATARHVAISDEVTNGFVAGGGTLLFRVTPRVLVGGEVATVQDQDRFVVTEPIGGIFPGSSEFAAGATTVGQNAQFVVAFYPGEQSRTHFEVGAGMGRSHVVASSRRAGSDGQGTGPIVSASFGTEWKMFYVSAGARFHRMRINYTSLDDQSLFGSAARGALVQQPNVDLSGVFVRAGLVFHWFRD